MKSLAIEREFGSGGREIGMRVAELAGIPYYDSELLVKAAHAQGISVDMLRDYDEKRAGSFLYDIAAFASYTNNEKNTVFEMFDCIQRTMQRLEMQGPAVFIGRCSTEILKERPQVLRVFIYCADPAKRVKRIMQTEEVSEADAKNLMQKRDKQRRNYFHFWTQKEWKDRKNYDLELNTATIPVEACAEILLQAMK